MADYRIPRGDDAVLVHTFTDAADGSAIDLTGHSVWFTLKASLADADADAVLNHWWSEAGDAGISRTDPDSGDTQPLAAGILYTHLTHDETDDLRLLRPYHYDVRIKTANSLYKTVETGTVTVTAHATTRTTLAP